MAITKREKAVATIRSWLKGCPELYQKYLTKRLRKKEIENFIEAQSNIKKENDKILDPAVIAQFYGNE